MITQLLEYIQTFFITLWESFCILCSDFALWLLDGLKWVFTEMGNVCFNEMISLVSDFSGLVGFNPAVTQGNLVSLATNMNVFLPIDDMITVAIFLLTTWFIVKIFAFTIYVILNIIP